MFKSLGASIGQGIFAFPQERMMSQLEIEFDESSKTICEVKSLSTGQLFKIVGRGKYTYMKVKSIGFLNNSDILSDVFARGDCLVVNMERGTVGVIKGTELAIKLSGSLKVKRMV